MTEPLLRMEHISKRFPGVVALDDVSLGDSARRGAWPARRERRGQVHLAEDPLRRLSAGCRDDHARAARPVTLPTPLDAQRQGIVTIYQEFNLIPTMTVAENMFLGREPGRGAFVSWKRMRDDDRRKCCGTARPRPRPDDAGQRSLGRRAADGGDRPRALDGIAHHRHGRADLGADRARGRAAVPHHRRAEERGASASSTSPTGCRRWMQICDRVTCCATAQRVGGGNGAANLKDRRFRCTDDGRAVGHQLFTRLGGHRAHRPGGHEGQGHLARPRPDQSPRDAAEGHQPRGARPARSSASPG